MQGKMPPPDQFENFIDDIFIAAKGIMIRKNADYGVRNLEQFGEFGIAVRVTDKISRLSNLIGSNTDPHVKDESIADTWIDVLNYAALALMMRRVATDSPRGNRRPLAYLGGSIEGIPYIDASEWRQQCSRYFLSVGIDSFDPLIENANDVAAGKMADMWTRNTNAIQNCDIFICNLHHNAKSFGSLRELQMATELGKDIYVIHHVTDDSVKNSLYDVHNVFHTIDEAASLIVEKWGSRES